MSRSLSRISMSELQLEIRHRQRSSRALESRHARLSAKLRALEVQIEELGGNVSGKLGGGRGSRPKNDMTLVEALAQVLDGKTMSVTDVAEAVQKAGYRTNSNNFRTQVNLALIKGGKFKRVRRGQYTAK